MPRAVVTEAGRRGLPPPPVLPREAERLPAFLCLRTGQQTRTLQAEGIRLSPRSNIGSPARTAAVADLERALQEILPQARLCWQALPEDPELGAWLVDPASLNPIDADSAARIAEAPPYWTVIWPAARVLAAQIRARPALVRGRRVLDLGCGAGLVALAAAQQGAIEVWACDIDPQARQASRLNAATNGVAGIASIDIDALSGIRPDLVLAADLIYAAPQASLLEPWLAARVELLVADCRARPEWLTTAGLQLHKTVQNSVWPPLDPGEQFRHVRIANANGETRF